MLRVLISLDRLRAEVVKVVPSTRVRTRARVREGMVAVPGRNFAESKMTEGQCSPIFAMTERVRALGRRRIRHPHCSQRGVVGCVGLSPSHAGGGGVCKLCKLRRIRGGSAPTSLSHKRGAVGQQKTPGVEASSLVTLSLGDESKDLQLDQHKAT